MKTNECAVRLPVEPLMKATGLTLSQISKKTGTDFCILRKDAEKGGLLPDKADTLAVRLGTHPGMVWGNTWWELPDGACGPLEISLAEKTKAANKCERQRRYVANKKEREAVNA